MHKPYFLLLPGKVVDEVDVRVRDDVCRSR